MLEKIPQNFRKKLLFLPQWVEPEDFLTSAKVRKLEHIRRSLYSVQPTQDNHWIWFGEYRKARNLAMSNDQYVQRTLFDIFVRRLRPNERITNFFTECYSDVNPFKCQTKAPSGSHLNLRLALNQNPDKPISLNHSNEEKLCLMWLIDQGFIEVLGMAQVTNNLDSDIDIYQEAPDPKKIPEDVFSAKYKSMFTKEDIRGFAISNGFNPVVIEKVITLIWRD